MEQPAVLQAPWLARKVAPYWGGFAGPIGMTLGGLAGAILGGLAGGTAGSLAGARMGEEIDSRVLDNFECQHCGLAFSQNDY
ncbi:TPA: hypothetical protein NH723_000993 [Pseudomonas aeruginosa]|nr:hypothetical protein [Pseudomonas aeruginosa]